MLLLGKYVTYYEMNSGNTQDNIVKGGVEKDEQKNTCVSS